MKPLHMRRVRERAYLLWIESGCRHGNDVADWLRAERETAPAIRVTFDSNAWQQVVHPHERKKDPSYPDFCLLHQAAVDGEIAAFIVETVATLEAVKRTDRASYLAGAKPEVTFTESVEGGLIKIAMEMGPKAGYHPGIHPILDEKLHAAFKLGFKFLKVPRIGQPSPPITLDKANFVFQSPGEMGKRQEATFSAIREIEARGVGKAKVDAIGKGILARLGKKGSWWSHLDKASPAEIHEIAKAVGEWADGDSIAGHVGYSNDFFCTEDKGISAGGDSVLSPMHRRWATEKFGVNFLTLSELADLIRQ